MQKFWHLNNHKISKQGSHIDHRVQLPAGREFICSIHTQNYVSGRTVSCRCIKQKERRNCNEVSAVVNSVSVISVQSVNRQNKRIASSDASLPKGDRRSRGLREELESGTVLGTTLRSMQQPMRRISWAASLCLPLPVDNN